jgi:hypothetical protein
MGADRKDPVSKSGQKKQCVESLRLSEPPRRCIWKEKQAPRCASVQWMEQRIRHQRNNDEVSFGGTFEEHANYKHVIIQICHAH